MPDSQHRESRKYTGKKSMLSIKQSALVAESVEMEEIENSRTSEVNLYENKSDEMESPKKEMEILEEREKNEQGVQINMGTDMSTSIRKSVTSKNLRKDFFEAHFYSQGDMKTLKGRYKLNS